MPETSKKAPKSKVYVVIKSRYLIFWGVKTAHTESIVFFSCKFYTFSA